jgi:hypothetical protein
LFPDNFIEREFGIPVLFNYRGGNVNKNVDYLKIQGIEFLKENVQEDRIGSTIFTDPNGRGFF